MLLNMIGYTRTEFTYHVFCTTLAPPTPTPTHILLPDLTVPGAGVTYYGCPWDQPGHISVSVKNIGSGDAGFFLVGINKTPIPVTALAANDMIKLTTEFDQGPVGHINVIADSEQHVPESDETNNQFRLHFTPPPYCTSSPTPTQSGY